MPLCYIFNEMRRRSVHGPLQCIMLLKSTATLSRDKASRESEDLVVYVCMFSFLKLSWDTQQICGSVSV